MNKPVKKLTVGSIQVASWLNEGKSGNFYTFTISRRFKDEKDSWQSSNSLRLSDLPKAIFALQEAYRQFALKEFSQLENDLDIKK
ncbi:MAG: hypothetical protein N3F05_03735 [Candidatus Diapherotrites archaeon]|nr:hypothetical protein [Candidatus Diapherotrites archaeon]